MTQLRKIKFSLKIKKMLKLKINKNQKLIIINNQIIKYKISLKI